MKPAEPVALTLVAALQALLGTRVFARMLATAAGDAVAQTATVPAGASLAAIVPVLDERDRLAPALEGLVAQPPELRQILIVDGGSTDGTQAIVRRFAARDPRVVLVDAGAPGPGWNGKMWNLAAGLAASDPGIAWILTMDADVRPGPNFAASLLSHAAGAFVDAFSAAPRFALSGPLEAVIHPAFLATLVYRRGLPGGVARSPREVQANGQCFVAKRDLLVGSAAFSAARTSRCDDYTIARTLVARGAQVGFYEGGDLATVRMYAGGLECWSNWPRSLSLDDGTRPAWEFWLGIAEIALVQALPLTAVVLGICGPVPRSSVFFRLNLALLIARIAVQFGTARAYVRPGIAYRLSFLADVPAAVAIVGAALRKRASWRGRELVRT